MPEYCGHIDGDAGSPRRSGAAAGSGYSVSPVDGGMAVRRFR